MERGARRTRRLGGLERLKKMEAPALAGGGADWRWGKIAQQQQ